jgi:hypothetical protein
MKIKLMLSGVLVSVVLGGCATTGSDTVLTAKKITDRYAAALYGKDGLKKHPSMTTKGTLSIEQFGIEGPFVRYAMAPDSNVSIIELMGMSLSTGCHKGACWAQAPGAGTMTLTGDAAAMQLQQSDYALWQNIDRYYTSMEIVPPADGQDSATHKIKAVKQNGDTDYYDFAKDSGLLNTAIIEGETAQGRMTITIKFSNYRDFDGMLIPTELIQETPQAAFKITFNEVSFAPLTEDKFAKPN